MNFSRRRLFVTAGAAGVAGLALAPRVIGAEQPSPVRVKSPLLGEAMAPKRLVVWGSYTCPYTALMLVTLKGIVNDLKETASVEWHHFPTHPPDPALHVAGLSFEGEHFWGFAFRVLTEVYNAGGQYKGLTDEKLVEFAKAEGGSAETLQAAYKDKAKWQVVQEDLMAGRLLGATRTPALFYNGYFMTPDGIPRDMKAFDKSLRAMLQAG